MNSFTYADLELKHDSLIPRDEIGMCVEPRPPVSPVEWARRYVRFALADLRCVRDLLQHPNAILQAGAENAARITLQSRWLAYRSEQANALALRIVDVNLRQIVAAFDRAA